MKRIALILSFLTITNAKIALSDQVFFLNQFGKERFYSISSFDDSGSPLNELVASPENIGARHLAWPSALRVEGQVMLYSSINREGWHEVGLWTSDDGEKFAFRGVVFSSEDVGPTAAHGIGPAHVGYFPDEPFPFVMYYTVRGDVGPSPRIAAAKSKEGLKWQIVGDIFQAEASFEANGVVPSYVCKYQDKYYLFYLAFDSADYSTASAGLAVSDGSSLDMFDHHTQIFPHGGYQGAVISGEMHASEMTVDGDQDELKLSNPYIISDSEGAKIQIVVPTEKDNDTILIDRPLKFDAGNFQIASLFSNKVDPSFIYQEGGRWHGLFTTFGSFDGLITEFVVPMKAERLRGPWQYDPSFGNRVPYFVGTEGRLNSYSLENPIRLASDGKCSKNQR